ncbi:MAG: branched-chain amino acid ABC transporter permease [Firmicutes bacterium]|nr:branched-chain amino acid ABC transporter permease [Bacillota bacterium]
MKHTGRWSVRFLWPVGLLFALELAIWIGLLDEYWTLIMVSICINVILAVSLNLINGFTGQFSLGHAGFMAVGGYTAAVIGLKWMPPLIAAGTIPTWKNITLRLGGLPEIYLPFAKALLPGGVVLFCSIVLGGLFAAAMGFLIGLPTLRLRGDYLAIATLGFGEIIRLSFLNIEYLGGATGMPNIPQYTTVFSSFVTAAATVILIGNIIRSTHGRAMLAVREDEIAAEAMGVNTTRYKVIAFTVGAFFAGVAGALYAHTYYVVNPRCFSFMKTIDVLVMVVLGGQGSMVGAIMGAISITVLNAFLGDLPTVRMIVYALFLVALMIFLPRGLLTVGDLFRLRFGSKEGERLDAPRHG